MHPDFTFGQLQNVRTYVTLSKDSSSANKDETGWWSNLSYL